MPTTSPMTIGDLSRQTGCKIETIRYYEKIGMLSEPQRSEGGHRQYAPGHLKRLTFIRRARALGFTLEKIRALLSLSERRNASCASVREVARDHLVEVRSRIADLQAMESVLDDLVTRCRGKFIPDCPIIESLSQVAPGRGEN